MSIKDFGMQLHLLILASCLAELLFVTRSEIGNRGLLGHRRINGVITTIVEASPVLDYLGAWEFEFEE